MSGRLTRESASAATKAWAKKYGDPKSTVDLARLYLALDREFLGPNRTAREASIRAIGTLERVCQMSDWSVVSDKHRYEIVLGLSDFCDAEALSFMRPGYMPMPKF